MEDCKEKEFRERSLEEARRLMRWIPETRKSRPRGGQAQVVTVEGMVTKRRIEWKGKMLQCSNDGDLDQSRV